MGLEKERKVNGVEPQGFQGCCLNGPERRKNLKCASETTQDYKSLLPSYSREGLSMETVVVC